MRHLFKTNSSKFQVSEFHINRSLCIDGHKVQESVAKLKTGSQKTHIYVTLRYTVVVQVSRGNSTPGRHSETQSLLSWCPSFSRMMTFSPKIPQATCQYPLYDSPSCPLASALEFQPYLICLTQGLTYLSMSSLQLRLVFHHTNSDSLPSCWFSLNPELAIRGPPILAHRLQAACTGPLLWMLRLLHSFYLLLRKDAFHFHSSRLCVCVWSPFPVNDLTVDVPFNWRQNNKAKDIALLHLMPVSFLLKCHWMHKQLFSGSFLVLQRKYNGKTY